MDSKKILRPHDLVFALLGLNLPSTRYPLFLSHCSHLECECLSYICFSIEYFKNFMCKDAFPAMYFCVSLVCSVHEGQQKAWDSLELDK